MSRGSAAEILASGKLPTAGVHCELHYALAAKSVHGPVVDSLGRGTEQWTQPC
jgi:hypothetical protein